MKLHEQENRELEAAKCIQMLQGFEDSICLGSCCGKLSGPHDAAAELSFSG